MLAEPFLARGDGGIDGGGATVAAADDDAPMRPRVELFDNAKAVLIVCVVLYHTSVVYTSADRPEVRNWNAATFIVCSTHFVFLPQNPIPFWSGLLALLKAVVMPSFCLISGYLSRAGLPRRIRRSPNNIRVCVCVRAYTLAGSQVAQPAQISHENERLGSYSCLRHTSSSKHCTTLTAHSPSGSTVSTSTPYRSRFSHPRSR